MAQQSAAYNTQHAQALQASYAYQVAQQQAHAHLQQGMYPAVTPSSSSAAGGYPGHMGPGGTNSASSHAGTPSWMQNQQPHAVPSGWIADRPGVYAHPHGAIVPDGFRYLKDGTGRIERIATGAEA